MSLQIYTFCCIIWINKWVAGCEVCLSVKNLHFLICGKNQLACCCMMHEDRRIQRLCPWAPVNWAIVGPEQGIVLSGCQVTWYGRYHIRRYHAWCLSIIQLVIEFQLETHFGHHGGEVRQIFGLKLINLYDHLCQVSLETQTNVQK